MVHKKYTVKDGKSYGPYFYENKRVGKKVVTNYLGRNFSDEAKINYFYAVLLILLIVMMVFFVFNRIFPTGNAVLDIKTDYNPGDFISGKFNLSLQPGELIPANTTVEINFVNRTRTFLLSDLIGNQAVSGNYYLFGASLSGFGLGYGIAGSKVDYPNVDFSFSIEDSGSASSPNINSGNNSLDENSSLPLNSSETLSNLPNSNETNISDSSSAQDSNSSLPEQPSSDNSNSSSPPEQSPVQQETSSLPNFSITGNDILNSNIISGTVSKYHNFIYNLNDNANVSIDVGSVKYKGTAIGDDKISLSIAGGILTVFTNYSFDENGFGADYSLGNSTSLSFNLSNLNIPAENGTLNIRLIYGNSEIFSVSQNILVFDNVHALSLRATDCSSSECFYIRDNLSNNLMILDKKGNIDIKGALREGNFNEILPNSFIIKNSSGAVKAWVDSITGNLSITGNSTADSDECNPPLNSFVIRDSSGRCVSYIDSYGNLFAKGKIVNNSNI